LGIERIQGMLLEGGMNFIIYLMKIFSELKTSFFHFLGFGTVRPNPSK
jgi:hypothetical protein